MRETLLIRLSESLDADWRVHGSEAAEPASGRGAIEETLPQCQGRRVILLVPGADILLCTAHVPGLGGQKLRQALPYALEDDLAEDVEALHFALGAVGEQGRRAVAVVARRHMDAWLAPFRDNGIEPDAVYPEVLGVPRVEDDATAWSLLLDGGQVLVRTGSQSGFACEPAMLSDMVGLEPPSEDRQVTVYVTRENRQRVEELSAAIPGAEVRVELCTQIMDCLAEGLDRHAIDLRQGRYALRSGWQRWGLPFRATAALLATLFLIHMGVLGARYVSLSQQSAELKTQARQIFTQLFPGNTRIEDIRAQTEDHLNALRKAGGADTGLFFLLEKTAQALNATPKLTLQDLQYHQNALFITLHGTDLGDLETLRQKFSSESGVSLEVQSANSGENGVQLRLRIGVAAT